MSWTTTPTTNATGGTVYFFRLDASYGTGGWPLQQTDPRSATVTFETADYRSTPLPISNSPHVPVRTFYGYGVRDEPAEWTRPYQPPHKGVQRARNGRHGMARLPCYRRVVRAA